MSWVLLRILEDLKSITGYSGIPLRRRLSLDNGPTASNRSVADEL
jgi:hypothetical protein